MLSFTEPTDSRYDTANRGDSAARVAYLAKGCQAGFFRNSGEGFPPAHEQRGDSFRSALAGTRPLVLYSQAVAECFHVRQRSTKAGRRSCQAVRSSAEVFTI